VILPIAASCFSTSSTCRWREELVHEPEVDADLAAATLGAEQDQPSETLGDEFVLGELVRFGQQ
jgi:hypothetical protein